MRINHNISAMVSHTAVSQSTLALNKSLERLASGYRINRAADDAAGLAVSEQLRTQIRGLAKAKRNAEDGIALLQISEGAANEISSLLQRMRELAIQSANDTLTSVERGYSDTEFSALMSEIQRISSATQYNGVTLLDGASTSFGTSGGSSSVLHIGANNNNGSVSGSIDTLTVTIDSVTLGALGLSLNASTGTNITNQANAFSAITSIDTAILSVNTMRANIGAVVNRLESAINNLSNQEYNMQAAESLIRDADFAYETTQFTRAQIMVQTGMAMVAQANTLPQNVLKLVQY